MKNYDLVIVGGGPAGIFAALEIMKLKPDYQRAVYLADIEELSYKEIGQILQKSESGIKVLIHRARKSLEDIVRKEAGKYEG